VRLWRTLEMALRSVARNKMRSGLTMLGIVIGVAVVVAMVAIGAGAKYSVRSLIQGLGTRLLIVRPGSAGRGGVHGGMGSLNTLTAEDIEAVLRQCPAIAAASPVVRTGAQAVAGNANWNTSIQGVTCDYLWVRDWELSQGTCFGASDVRRAAKVCLLGQTVARKLFGDADAYGRTIRIADTQSRAKVPFRVIGVLQSKGGGSWGGDQDDTIMIPYTAAQRRLMGIDYIQYAYLSAVSDAAIPGAVEKITAILRDRHRLRDGEENDFRVITQLDIQQRAQAQMALLSRTFLIVALVSLAVGGIGVMNIMLVSVTERTREIGIRMAVGAKGRHILMQFLTEAVVLCLIGGAAGIVAGVAISGLVSHVMAWPVKVSSSSIVLAVGVSGAIGVFFGFYPARRAARMNPIEALRHE